MGITYGGISRYRGIPLGVCPAIREYTDIGEYPDIGAYPGIRVDPDIGVYPLNQGTPL
jgi:hypothetical protein